MITKQPNAKTMILCIHTDKPVKVFIEKINEIGFDKGVAYYICADGSEKKIEIDLIAGIYAQ